MMCLIVFKRGNGKMKKRILLLLTVTLCVFLCACGGIGNGDKNASILTEKEGVVCINRDKFSEILERVELTTENWSEYIKVYSYDEERITRDAFGEVTSSEIIKHYCIGAGNERYHQFQDAVLELKNKETGELTVYYLDRHDEYDGCYVSEDFNLADYECTRIKGRLYFVNIPAEALHSPLPAVSYDWGYENGFYLVNKHHTTPYEVESGSKMIYRNGSNSWDEFLNE